MPDLMERLGPALPSRYRLIREIGRGGAAQVFLARELHPDREVAIKVLDPGIAVWVGSERFLREIDLASKLSHPHILPIFAAGDADGLLYYVMPYVVGESLRDRLARERQLPPDQALGVACEVADALSYAHHCAIVHRDIKPENILLHGAHAVVADFGVARAISGGARTLTEPGRIVGTLAYMSPEQATGSEAVDGRADIYGLGCVLYEMLVGEPPHTGQSIEEILARKLEQPIQPPSLLRQGLAPEIDRVLLMALARAPADRFSSAAELRDALAALVGGGPLAARGWSAPIAAAPPARRPLEATEVPPLRPRVVAPSLLAGRGGLALVLAAVLIVNWIQTTVDNRIGASSELLGRLRHQLAHAMHWVEGHWSFAGHEATNDLAAYGYTAVYFFLFPALLVVTAVALLRRSLSAARVGVTAVMIDYALSLPFFILLPVPERWSDSEFGAVLLSDRWTSSLIETVRPISALDNCFPSFHVSLTVIVVLVCFAYELRFRLVALACSLAVVFSTVALGIHWAADVVAGAAVGVASVALALRWEGRRARGWSGVTLVSERAAPATPSRPARPRP